MKKTVRRAILAFILGVIVIALYFFGRGYICYKKATKGASLEDKVNQIRSSEKFVSWNEMPENYRNAVIAVEDHRFYEHGTVDFIAITRALTSNLRKKELAEGGSTITQQVVKNLYFMEADTKSDSLDRKFAEIIVGIQLEKNYSKEEIFELYANNIYFGDGYYCLKDAAKGYFNKEPKDMTLDECTMLAGIPNAPSVYSPTVNPDLAKQRQQKVISSMVKYGYLTQD
jgi:membrane peptidoglycan carboxypeptidase